MKGIRSKFSKIMINDVPSHAYLGIVADEKRQPNTFSCRSVENNFFF